MRAPRLGRRATLLGLSIGSGLLVGALLLGQLVAQLALPGRSRAEIIERVVAVVNEDAILYSELRARSLPFLERALDAPSETERMERLRQLYSELLTQMINETLIIQVGEQMQIHISEVDVDRAIANVQQQSGLNDAQFWQAVGQQGYTREHYRHDVERQLFRFKVLNRRVRNRVNITEEEVRARYDEMVARARRTASFVAAHVFIPVADNASATETAAARRQAEEVREGITDVESFEEAMDEFGGSELGTLSQGDLAPALEEVLLGLSPGDVSPAIRGPAGFHIFLLRSRERASANLPAYNQVRMQIYRQMVETAMARQERIFLNELRRRAIIEVRLEGARDRGVASESAVEK